ncbi:hypothetical protein V491_08825 [Pseudogymnoascus sp. VKM F-3775]|nr:hypothetical protein V491_08825 [Pseudogymnoascus sp. VKM F-3775]
MIRKKERSQSRRPESLNSHTLVDRRVVNLRPPLLRRRRNGHPGTALGRASMSHWLRLRDPAHALRELSKLDDFVVDGESSDAIVSGAVLEK